MTYWLNKRDGLIQTSMVDTESEKAPGESSTSEKSSLIIDNGCLTLHRPLSPLQGDGSTPDGERWRHQTLNIVSSHTFTSQNGRVARDSNQRQVEMTRLGHRDVIEYRMVWFNCSTIRQ